jgi:hypothetical protein
MMMRICKSLKMMTMVEVLDRVVWVDDLLFLSDLYGASMV